MYEDSITGDTLLVQMTAGQLADYLRTAINVSSPVEVSTTGTPSPRLVYGLKGIQRLFGCSNVTAQRYKAGIIKDAVHQYGRKIVTDADKALELFNAAKNGTNTQNRI